MAGESDVIGVGVERGIKFLELAEPGEELVVEDGTEQRAELAELFAILLGQVRLGHQEPGEVARADRQGSFAKVDHREREGLLHDRRHAHVFGEVDLVFGVDRGLQGSVAMGFPGG